MDGCFPLFYLLAYLLVYWKSSGKFPTLYFFQKSYSELVVMYGQFCCTDVKVG